MAKEKGCFRDAGFEVAVKAGGGTPDDPEAVADGQVQSAPFDLTGLLPAAGGRQPVTGFAAAAAVEHRTTAAIIPLAGTGIAAPKDLMGPFVRSAAWGVPVGALDGRRVARSIAILRGSGRNQADLTPDQIAAVRRERRRPGPPLRRVRPPCSPCRRPLWTACPRRGPDDCAAPPEPSRAFPR